MGSYDVLRQIVEQIPWADGHSHVLHHDIEPAAWEGPYEVLPLARLLLDFNTRLIFIDTGLPEQKVTDILMGRVEPAEQKRLLLTCRGIWSRTVMRYLLRGLKDLYGVDVQAITEENWDMVNEALTHSRDDFHGLLEQVFAKGGIKTSVLNLWAPRCYTYLTKRDHSREKDWFVFSTTVDYRSLMPFGPMIRTYAEQFGMPMETLAEYEALVEEICRWSVEEMGVRAFKNTEMYFRCLDYRVRTYEEAAPCYKPDPTDEERRIVSDYEAGIICRMAAKFHVPIQIHTGSIWGDFVPDATSPEHLAAIIGAYPDTKFELLHGGDPFFGTTALMGAGFPNVYVNMSSMPCHSIENFEHWLSVYLDRIPSQKLILGWDLFTPEILCGAASYGRDMVARVLAGKVDAGLYSVELAEEIAKDIMYRNVERLFGR